MTCLQGDDPLAVPSTALKHWSRFRS